MPVPAECIPDECRSGDPAPARGASLQKCRESAEFLKNHPKVAWVEYAGLADSKYHALAEKYMPNGTCGVLCFGPKGGRDGAMRFTNGLKMVAIVTHVADARSCVLHPASHTHRQLNDQQLIEAGVLPDLIRLSVGIEDVNDIIADLIRRLRTYKDTKNRM